jgi:hypothetical protein
MKSFDLFLACCAFFGALFFFHTVLFEFLTYMTR